jgi:hypothetical protein
MRRFLAITIMLLLGLPMVSPLFALDVDAANLPACCRRDGMHHCMMAGMMMAGMSSGGMMTAGSSTGASATPDTGTSQPTFAIVTAPCPYGPQGMPGAVHRDWTLDTASAVFAGLMAHPAGSPQTESKRRLSSLRARHKRGPPVVSL